MISHPVARRQKQQTSLFPYLLSGLLAIIFYIVVFRFALNVPDIDDYAHLFTTVRLLDPATTFGEWMHLFFNQHNDHRIILSRLLVLGDYALEGHVNFRTLILVASLAVAGLFGVLLRLFRAGGLSVWTVAPVAVLLFQLSYYDNICWPLSAMQHTISLLGYFMLFPLVLKPSARAQVAGLALAALLLYSNSNGLFAWMIAVGLLGFRQQWRWAAVWLVAGAVLVGLYFGVDYDFRSQSSFSVIVQHPTWLVKSVVSFLGAAVYLDGIRWLLLPAPWVIYATGLLVLVVFAWAGFSALLQKKYGQNNAFMTLLAVALVLLATAGAAALTRSDGNLLIADRYQLYALFCVILAYAFILFLTADRWRRPVMILFSIVCVWFYVNSWAYYPLVLKNRTSKLVSKTYSLQRYGIAPVSDLFLIDPFWQGLWQKTLRTGLYRFPETSLGNGAVLSDTTGTRLTNRLTITTEVDPAVNAEKIFLRSSEETAPDFIVIRSGKQTHVLPIRSFPPDRHLALLAGVYGPGFESYFYPKAVAAGDYRIGFLNIKAGKPEMEWLNQQIEVDN